MNLNENTTKGKWLEMKGEIQKAWGKLTDNELEESKGDMKKIAGIIQQRYGEVQKVRVRSLQKFLSDMKKKEFRPILYKGKIYDYL